MSRSDRRRANPPATVVELRPGSPLVFELPAAPSHWLASTKATWLAFWRSDLATAVHEPDLPAVERLFDLRDERRRAMAAVRRARVVEGSQGQPVLNPLAGYASTLEREIVALEDRLGLSPLARARLGISVGQAKMTAQVLNRMTDRTVDVDVDDAEDVELLAEFGVDPDDDPGVA